MNLDLPDSRFTLSDPAKHAFAGALSDDVAAFCTSGGLTEWKGTACDGALVVGTGVGAEVGDDTYDCVGAEEVNVMKNCVGAAVVDVVDACVGTVVVAIVSASVGILVADVISDIVGTAVVDFVGIGVGAVVAKIN
jgi:hypothetical protein